MFGLIRIGHGIFVAIITTEDSVYNDLKYKKILHEGWAAELWGLTGLLREDSINRQVWYIEPDSTKERIIYDFSLNEEDSVFLQFNTDAYASMLEDGWYFVDSIRTRKIMNFERRVFYLDNPLNEDLDGFGSTRPYIEWIEGVGSNLHPAYFNIEDCAADLCGISFIYGASIICAFKDDLHIYQDSCFFPPYMYEWTCYTPADVKELSKTNLFSIYPNPASNKVFIKAETKSEKYNIVVRDIQGKALKYLEIKYQEIEIDVSDLISGIYFITITGNQIIQTKKLLIKKGG